MARYTADLWGDASQGWGLPLPLLPGGLSPHLHGAALGVSPGLCGGGGGVVSQGSLDWAEPGSLQCPGNTVHQNVQLAPFPEQPGGILPVLGSQSDSSCPSVCSSFLTRWGIL